MQYLALFMEVILHELVTHSRPFNIEELHMVHYSLFSRVCRVKIQILLAVSPLPLRR